MGDYTLTNFANVEDSAAQHGLSEVGTARFAKKALDAQQVGIALHQLHPGKRQAFGHRHTQAEEVYVVLEGSGQVMLDDELVALSTRDALRVGPTVARRFEAGSDGMELLVFGQHFAQDGELLSEFWAN